MAHAVLDEPKVHMGLPLPNGKLAIEVFTRELPITVASQCSIDNVVLLARQNSGAARLTRYPKAQVLED